MCEFDHVLISSVDKLLDEDKELFENEGTNKVASERCIAHRLANYIEEKLNKSKDKMNLNYKVDCEYNRFNGCYKLLKVREENKSRVYPDIIVHKRGQQDGNLAWIELKIFNSSHCTEKTIKEDKEKIKLVTGGTCEISYKLGYFILFRREEAKTIYTIEKKVSSAEWEKISE